MENDINEAYNCKCTIIHDEIINKVRNSMIEDGVAYNVAEFFKVFGDSTRVKIIYALSVEEMCVCDVSALLNMSQSAISHQLKVLRQAKLVKIRKVGKIVYYSLDDDHIKEIVSLGLLHVNEK